MEEFHYYTIPTNLDTDSDGCNDGLEVKSKTNSLERDTDYDSYNDYLEIEKGLNPLDMNSKPQ